MHGCGSVNVFWNDLDSSAIINENVTGSVSKAGFGILSGAGSFTARFNSFWSIC